MPEQDTQNLTTGRQAPTRRRRPDLFTLVIGLATLGVSGYLLSDGETWLPGVDLRWAVAGGAVLIGVLMLLASIRTKE